MITGKSIREDYPQAVAELSRNGVNIIVNPILNIIILEKNGLRTRRSISEFSAFNEAQKNGHSVLEKQSSEYSEKLF